MGAACFCEFMELLKPAAPLLDASETPTLAALAAFAAEFKPLPPSASAAAPGAPQPGMQTLGGVVKKTPAAGPAPAAVPPPKLGAWGRGGDVSLGSSPISLLQYGAGTATQAGAAVTLVPATAGFLIDFPRVYPVLALL